LTVIWIVRVPLWTAETLAAVVTLKCRIKIVSTCSKPIPRTRPFIPDGWTAPRARVARAKPMDGWVGWLAIGAKVVAVGSNASSNFDSVGDSLIRRTLVRRTGVGCGRSCAAVPAAAAALGITDNKKALNRSATTRTMEL